MRMIFLTFILFIQTTCFSNVCPKVGIGDARNDFEKVYGKPEAGPLALKKNMEDIVIYSNEDIVGSFYVDKVYSVILNHNKKELKLDQVEELIKQHIPPDSVMIHDWEYGISQKPFVNRQYYSQTIADTIDFAKKNKEEGNFYVSVGRDFKNTIYTFINISVIEPKPSKEEIEKKKEELRKQREAEKKAREEYIKQLHEEELTPQEKKIFEGWEKEEQESLKKAKKD